MSHRAGAPRSGDASKANTGSNRLDSLGITHTVKEGAV
jgi:hypothetical protein